MKKWKRTQPKNSMKRHLLWLLLALTCSPAAQAQDSLPELLPFHQFLELVFKQHPRVRQAELQAEQGQAVLRAARGNFDPVLKSSYSYKHYDDKDYYRINDNSLVLPTWFGMEVKGGYEQNSGMFLNPELNVPGAGLAYAGISMPLLQGLFIDERRNVLRQAQVGSNAAIAERELLLNDLFAEAAAIYWDWFSSWNALRVYQQGVDLAEFRRKAVRSSFEQGDLPAIDTLEALIQVQYRLSSRNEAFIKFRKTQFDLNNFLWENPEMPMEIGDSLRLPTPFENLNSIDMPAPGLREELLSNLDSLHPELRWYRYKVERLDIERRWKAEKLKPLLNVNYNFLNQPVAGDAFEGFNSQNYKWGIDFKFPLLLRTERGHLQTARIKLEQADLDLERKSLELRNKVNAFHTEIENLQYQIGLYRQAVENLRGLLSGERRMFEEGESSLFLVNSRENALISAEIKLVELLADYQKAAAGLLWASGNSMVYVQQIVPEL
jgi:outer membrane protein TolC